MTNPRKGSYGYTFRIDAGIDLTDFNDITLQISASCGADSWALNLSASTLFIGHSTVYSSSEGLTLKSAEWAYGANATASPFATADNYFAHLECSGSGTYFISPKVTFTIDP